MNKLKIRGDFNGLFDNILCLSHSNTAKDDNGNMVILHSGMQVRAFDDDLDNNNQPDELFAEGTVEPSPDWLQCTGSSWVLKIDENGVRHESDLKNAK